MDAVGSDLALIVSTLESESGSCCTQLRHRRHITAMHQVFAASAACQVLFQKDPPMSQRRNESPQHNRVFVKGMLRDNRRKPPKPQDGEMEYMGNTGLQHKLKPFPVHPKTANPRLGSEGERGGVLGKVGMHEYCCKILDTENGERDENSRHLHKVTSSNCR